MLAKDFLFPSRLAGSPHLSTRQYARIVLNPATYGTHSLRRTKAALIYRKTGNLRAVQLLLGHSRLESTVRYLGVEEIFTIWVERARVWTEYLVLDRPDGLLRRRPCRRSTASHLVSRN